MVARNHAPEFSPDALKRALTEVMAAPAAAAEDGGRVEKEKVEPLNESEIDHSIPLRTNDLELLLGSTPGLTRLERKSWYELARMLEATFHHDFLDEQSRLNSLYSSIDPDRGWVRVPGFSPRRSDRSVKDFLTEFDKVLRAANYQELNQAAIEDAIASPNEHGLTYSPQLELFDELKVYTQGNIEISRKGRTVKSRFRMKQYTYPGFRRMVVAFKFRDSPRELGGYAQSEVLYLRLFKDVPRVDMEMHLPEQGTKVRMRMIDKAQIASPVAMGLPPLLMKLVATSLLSLSIGGILALLVAPFSFAVKSLFGYHRAKSRHLANMIRHLYYLNMANNGCVINRIIDVAEEEETKEALLAYFVLWRYGHVERYLKAEELDREVERLLRDRTGCQVDFEIQDAISKLKKLGLVREDESGDLKVSSPLDAVRILDERWDQLFQYNGKC